MKSQILGVSLGSVSENNYTHMYKHTVTCFHFMFILGQNNIKNLIII